MAQLMYWVLIGQYIALTFFHLLAKEWAKAGYWFGATVIASSVMVMK